MNDLLSKTLQAAQGGVANIPADAALSNVTSWHSTLNGVPGAESVTSNLAKLKTALEGGDLQGAAGILPSLGSDTEKLASAAPDADKDGLKQLAAALKG
ncbi:hypothetical protein [Deinococcus sp.]|uniref:hypothetical protein n=1 Tax=Deinococcus sp. TaxID=47478 RepID=UPI003B5B0BA1